MFTRYPIAVPLHKSVADTLVEVIPTFRLMNTILTDQESVFLHFIKLKHPKIIRNLMDCQKDYTCMFEDNLAKDWDRLLPRTRSASGVK